MMSAWPLRRVRSPAAALLAARDPPRGGRSCEDAWMATVVAFHAHPDDEALLTGGTLARLAAEGNRVVIVVATDGVVDPASDEGAQTRLDELRASASVLGAARVVHLGYADSGHGPLLYPDPPDRVRFARAAEMTGVRVLEATVPRELVAWLFWPLRLLRLMVRYDSREIRAGFTPRSAITHRVNVRRFAAQKRAALAAHRSFARSSGRPARLARVMLALPVPVFGLLFGREWFVEPGAAKTAVSSDILSRPERADLV